MAARATCPPFSFSVQQAAAAALRESDAGTWNIFDGLNNASGVRKRLGPDAEASSLESRHIA
jgi:hypothetical protein